MVFHPSLLEVRMKDRQENRKKKWTGQQGTTDELFESVGKNTASRQNLCELLGIDVEKLALAIVMQDKGLHQ